MNNYHETVKQLLEQKPDLNKLCQNDYFIMRQHSDILELNKFDHVSFVGSEPISYVFNNPSQTYELLSEQNTLIEDKYLQLFITKKVFRNNSSIFNNDVNGENYKVIDKYDDIFKGFIRTGDYFILFNSKLNKYGVYILIDNANGNKYCNGSKKKIEFYGFINIGYLINVSGYLEEELNNFEEKTNFKIPTSIRKYLLQTSIIKYDKKLFHVDLENYNDELLFKFNVPSKSLSNINILKRIKDKDQNQINYKESNNEFIKNLSNGFLYLGIIEKIPLPTYYNIDSKYEELYLLMNFEEQKGIDLSFTLWKKTIINNNACKIFQLYSSENADKDTRIIEEEVKNYNVYDDEEILYSMKYICDI